MNVKKVIEKLTEVRDNICQEDGMTLETQEILESLLRHPMPKPENDNKPLTVEQKFRLRLVEKTGTGSTLIH